MAGFKVGDKVRCINAQKINNLVKEGEEYTISDWRLSYHENLMVELDEVHGEFYASRFELVEEDIEAKIRDGIVSLFKLFRESDYRLRLEVQNKKAPYGYSIYKDIGGTFEDLEKILEQGLPSPPKKPEKTPIQLELEELEKQQREIADKIAKLSQKV